MVYYLLLIYIFFKWHYMAGAGAKMRWESGAGAYCKINNLGSDNRIESRDFPNERYTAHCTMVSDRKLDIRAVLMERN